MISIPLEMAICSKSTVPMVSKVVFLVFLLRLQENGMAITGFDHQLENFTQTHTGTGCHGPNCYTNDVIYTVSMDQIRSVKDTSLYCDQVVDIDCYYVALTGLSGWLDIDGNLNTYWHGNGDSDTGCKCGESSSCRKDTEVCNCDAKESIILRDSNNVLSNTEAH